MITDVTALSRLIDTRMRDRGWSTRDVAKLSLRCPAGSIGHATVGKYRRGDHPDDPSDQVLKQLSWALEIPISKLRRAAGVDEPLPPWQPPPEAHKMSRAQRDVVSALIRLLVDVPTGPVVSGGAVVDNVPHREPVAELGDEGGQPSNDD